MVLKGLKLSRQSLTTLALVVGLLLIAAVPALKATRGAGSSTTAIADKPSAAEGPVAQINGKPIARLAADDWCVNGRGHHLASIIHDPAQTQFIYVDQSANFKLYEGRFSSHDKVVINGQEGTIQPGGKKIVFANGRYMVRRADPDVNLTGYYKTGKQDGSEVALFYHDATGTVVRTADGKDSEVVWGEYHRFSAPALGLEGAVEDANTLVFVPLNNAPARATPNAQVWLRSPVKLPAGATATKSK